MKSAHRLDIEAHRRSRNWTRKELAARVLWAASGPLFRLSPKILWEWRCFLLRAFGARIGRNVRILPSVRVMIPWNLTIDDEATVGDRAILYALGPMHIGRRAVISQGSHLCGGTHDYTRADFPLIKAAISVGEGAWVCADAFIGPDIRVGDYAVVGARSVVMKDVDAWTVVAGNPARYISDRPELRPAGDASQ